MENQNLIENNRFYKSDRDVDYFLKKEKLQNELLLLEEELKEASIIKKFSLKLKIVDKKMQIDLLELIIKEKEKEEEKVNAIKKDFVLAEGGSYFPSFTNEEKEVFDIEVSKYQVTQKMWTKLMDISPYDIFKSADYSSKQLVNSIGDNKPVYVSWWDALEFCNRLSKFCSLEPVYDLSNKDKGILKIIEFGGKIVNPDEANFENTEGFRLPTEVEWEWFARGGKKALEEGTFDRYFDNNFIFSSDRDYDKDNEEYPRDNFKSGDVGRLRPNALGIYDCCKNGAQWCYDSVVSYYDEIGKWEKENYEKSKIKNKKLYFYNAKNNNDYSRRIRGIMSIDDRFLSRKYSYNYRDDILETLKAALLSTFRVVRTVKNVKYLSNKEKDILKIFPKEEFKNMVLVKGGKYKPSFLQEEQEVFDIEVCKYITTQKMWLEVKEYNSAKYKGENRPIECVRFCRILSYCNKLSIKYGLKPVYDLSETEEEIVKIKQLNGEIVPLNIANFKDTEGFRLPTEIEWEWFARGGGKALEEGTFDYNYAGSNNIDEVAWYKGNTGCSDDFKGGETKNVGLKKPNQLGLYDCCGNVSELVHTIIEEKKEEIIVSERGGAWSSSIKECNNFSRFKNCEAFDCSYLASIYNTIGFRLVRTV